ncbi:lactate utilization protein C [Sporosarcina soli]|uniref:Lactate utilization protein C n=1 Tax=Sporosarcina soli TaxID=334736 RepID=A0ABW0TSK9_9BACL
MTGNIQGREAFLTKIAKQLGREKVATDIIRPKWRHQPQDKVLQGASPDELVDVLAKQCQVINTDFVVTTKEQLASDLHQTIVAYGGGPVVTWKDARFEQFGLTPLLKDTLPAEQIPVHEWETAKGKENIELVERANVGITISDITLAESGTAVLFSSKDKGRTVSFLPLKSIIIIPKSTIVPRMTQAARIIREKTANGEYLASCINFITGPSNSADIEMILVVGVHGPMNMTYIVVEDL